MNYHVIIATERRASTEDKPRQLALPMNADIVTQTGADAQGMPTYTVAPEPPQLHTMGASVTTPIGANILYAASWDGTSPWITVLKGQISDLKMAFAGWPMVDQATWGAANPPSSP